MFVGTPVEPSAGRTVTWIARVSAGSTWFKLLEKFHGPWAGSVDPIYNDYAY